MNMPTDQYPLMDALHALPILGGAAAILMAVTGILGGLAYCLILHFWRGRK